MPRNKRERTPIELLIEELKTADLRLRIEFPTPKRAKRAALGELIAARDQLDVIIQTMQE